MFLLILKDWKEKLIFNLLFFNFFFKFFFQVFLKIGGEVITGPIVISPITPMAPGDIRKLKAVDIPALAHIEECIVFSQTAVDFYFSGGMRNRRRKEKKRGKIRENRKHRSKKKKQEAEKVQKRNRKR